MTINFIITLFKSSETRENNVTH